MSLLHIQPILELINAGENETAKWETAYFFIKDAELVPRDVVRDLENKWLQADTETDRWKVVAECRRAIVASEANFVASRIKGMRGSPIWRAAIALDRRSVRRVAEEYGVSKSTVSRFRQAFGASPRGRGRPTGGNVPEIPPLHLI
ncbi:MAG TPA: hypothetical protein VMS60_01000 [Solirubrobacterales bacterium]|nr:hypothetical protein [Solirubrobacterales bacterium]